MPHCAAHLSDEAARHQFVEHPLRSPDPLDDLRAIYARLMP